MTRYSISIFALVLLTLVAFTGQTANAPKFMEEANLRYRIQLQNNMSAKSIQKLSQLLDSNGFDVAGINRETNSVDVITNEKGVALLNSKGIKGTEIKKRGWFDSVDKRYLNPTTLAAKMQSLTQLNPQISRVVEIGKSNQGRPILAMLLSTTLDVTKPEYHEKPTIIFDGLHHAREVMTPEIVVDVAETIIKYAASPAIQKILKGWNVWVVPMMNPDGANIVFTSNDMWRKNARADRDNVFGVDINRNYSYRWSECNGSSSSKGSATYRGASAASEPEIQAVIKLADMVHPAASLSYHSYSELVLYPFGCQGDLTGENKMIEKIADELSKMLPTDSGKGFYTPGTPWKLLYSVDGSSMDYYYAAHGALAYTFEVNQDFHPKYELRDATINKHRKAWMYFMERALNGMVGVDVIDGKTSKPTLAQIAIQGLEHKKKEAPLRTNNAGRFFKVLEQGSYIISAKLSDGRTAQISVTTTGQPQLVKLIIP